MSDSKQPATHGVTIKNLKVSDFASQETDCFEASVYIDGVRKGVASNAGHGGSNNYHPRALYDELNAIAKTLPPCDMTKFGISERLEQDPDILIGELVEAEITRKKIARMVTTKTWFRRPGEKYQLGQWIYLKVKTSPESIANLQIKYGAETVILGHNCHTLD